MVSSQDSSLNAQTKSKKSILRSIDKIKKAFPKGFFNGLWVIERGLMTSY